ncbi:MAG: delta(1)-pyrroline-2-carboxylate reductase family protein [Burkholderiaceae bacterium]
MHTFDHKQTEELLPFAPLVAQIEATLAAAKAGRAHCPVRTAVPLPGGGTLLTMPAADDAFAVVKTVTVHPDNPARGLPAIGVQVLLMDATTGQQLAVLDGEALTAQRTAAVSVAAVQRMRQTAPKRLLVIGAGVQGRVHAQAFAACLGVREVWIAGRSPEHVQSLMEELTSQDIAAHAVTDLAQATAQADLIVTATTSSTPVLPDTVQHGAIICAVGAFKASMAELPASVVQRSHVVVDTLAGCRAEAGDLLQANLDWTNVVALQDAGPLDSNRPAVFKSVGSALWDLAAARCAWQQFQATHP